MQQDPGELGELGQGQAVRLTLGDGATIDASVNQISFVPDEYLRLELSAGDERLQARSTAVDGSWSSVELRRRDRATDAWTTLDEVVDATPAETFRTVKSRDMEAQEDTGTMR